MFKLKVYYEDTDAGGVVYYANYLKYFERARTQILFNFNFNHSILKNKYDIIIVVKSCNINYLKSAKLDDELEVFTTTISKSKVQILLNQEIYSKGILIVEAKVTIVIINTKGKVSRIPLDLFNIF